MNFGAQHGFRGGHGPALRHRVYIPIRGAAVTLPRRAITRFVHHDYLSPCVHAVTSNRHQLRLRWRSRRLTNRTSFISGSGAPTPINYCFGVATSATPITGDDAAPTSSRCKE